MNRRAFPAALAAGLLASCEMPFGGAKEADNKKDTKSAPPAEAVQPPELQLDYALFLDDRGAERRIDEKYRFQGDDRFRVKFRPGFAAHVYLLNRPASSPSYQFLYPNPKIELSNPLDAGRVVTLPGRDLWYTIDGKKGIENLVLVAAAYPLVEFNTPERTIPRDECEDRLALVERDFRPSSSRRFEDKEWTKLFAARGAKTVIVLRMPLDHR